MTEREKAAFIEGMLYGIHGSGSPTIPSGVELVEAITARLELAAQVDAVRVEIADWIEPVLNEVQARVLRELEKPSSG